jgi:large subunit ribosomal protein L23
MITEKNTVLQEQHKYTFEVAKNANKCLVKQAVEKAFKVRVVTVNMITVPGKTRRVGRRQVKTSPWKKAMVTLEKGQKIEFFEGV